MAENVQATPTGELAEPTQGSVRRREGSWAPLLGAVGIVLVSLVFLVLMALLGDNKAPGSPADDATPSATAPPG